ncbi:transposase family protein [Deinococcus psychrotolerans]|uniref:transposase family protein n=1 Tax=Deinococcus psychrotolerans TaxID=2489213 RepID=UPI001F149B72|nr:transposase family protein [Deinococcus psychrotolerans]
MTLEFWCEYRTFAHLGNDWGVHEPTVRCTVERVEAALITSAQFQMPKKRVFQEAQIVCSIVAVDASEVPCERPKKACRPDRCRSAQDSSVVGTAASKSSTP